MESFGYEGWLLFLTFQADVGMGRAVGGPEINVVDFRFADSEELRERLLFVGGCTTALFITDPITLEDVRATDDVDLIVDLAGYAEWAQMQDQLRQKGFSESAEDAVICRMRLGELKVDFMPDDAKILGFTNRWYARGIETAVLHCLTAELDIKLLSPELFIATKLGAGSPGRIVSGGFQERAIPT